MKCALLAILLLAACSTYTPQPTEPNEASYTKLFPYYAESCAVSEIHKTATIGATVESGGAGGHSLLYLGGVCRDTSAGYPVLKLCNNPAEGGVGLSVNDHFKNANWVATPGRDFFYHGSVPQGAGLTERLYSQTEAKAQAVGIYDGVSFRDPVYKAMPPSMTMEDYTYDISIGTDYAPDFARNRFCARVPVSQKQMQDTVDYLNQVNQPYRAGEKDFHWDVLRDNCTHMVHNALGAAGVWDMLPQNEPVLFAAFDFPVPKNEFVNLLRRSYEIDLTDPGAIYEDKTLRDTFLRYDFLPGEPGVLAEYTPVISPNDVYSTTSRLIFFDDQIIHRYETNLEKFFSDKRYTDLHTNLDYYLDLYNQVLQARKPVDAYRPSSDPGFAAFYQRYYAYIDRMKAKTQTDIKILGDG